MIATFLIKSVFRISSTSLEPGEALIKRCSCSTYSAALDMTSSILVLVIPHALICVSYYISDVAVILLNANQMRFKKWVSLLLQVFRTGWWYMMNTIKVHACTLKALSINCLLRHQSFSASASEKNSRADVKSPIEIQLQFKSILLL